MNVTIIYDTKMNRPFTEAEKKMVKEHLNQFGHWFEEWEDDINNLTTSNYQDFNKKLLNWIYTVTVDYANHYKKIKTIVNFERCEMYPHDISQQLCNLYTNGIVPQYGSAYSASIENFNVCFRHYINMIRRAYEIVKYENTGVSSEFVKRLLPSETSQSNNTVPVRKTKRYIVNGILY